MKSKRILTYEEKYTLDFLSGYRTGKIEADREILIRVLHLKGKEQGRIPCKATICKINREIDITWMSEVIMALCKDQLSLETFEMYYDRLFLVTNASKCKGLMNFDKHPLQGTTEV